MKNLKHYGFLAMNKHKSQQEWTSSTSAKSGGAVLAAELRREMRKITSQIMHYNIGRHMMSIRGLNVGVLENKLPREMRA